ncbi:RAB1A [Mytilus edulis]|uniref:RAB1A n=1 Tax=Mytilus edulis TaxID=6550 RepID=A0A8S3SM95_MYTED|nr:RAB1A [Mytilus edulis]
MYTLTFSQGNTFTDEYKSTTEITVFQKSVEVDGKQVEVDIYDSCSKNLFGEKAYSKFRNKDGFIVMFDVTNYDSFANIKSFFDRIRQYSNRCILPVLVGNKIDTTEDRAIGNLLAEDFANEHDIPYIETSAKDGTMVTELFEKVLTDIINPSENVKQRQWRPFTSADLNSCKSCKCAIS